MAPEYGRVTYMMLLLPRGIGFLLVNKSLFVCDKSGALSTFLKAAHNPNADKSKSFNRDAASDFSDPHHTGQDGLTMTINNETKQ